jgi:hypothetical protein
MSLRNWYLIQTAAVDPSARKKTIWWWFNGESVLYLLMTLGLRHNMGASSATPVEKLRQRLPS